MTYDTDTSTDQSAAEPQKAQAQFALQRLFLKDISFEAPLGAKAFLKQLKPQVNQDISSRINKLNDENYEVVLNLTITVKSEEETLYLVEVQQAGIFMVKGLQDNQLAQLLNTQCPNILFPYARETVDNMVVKGGFPPLMLPPINFDALFQQAVMQAKAKAEQAASTGQEH